MGRTVPLQPGYRIERYVIEAPLGRGGMGAVYRARDERLQRSVALKILRLEATATGLPSSAPSTEGAARLLREARAAAALDHPNVVAIFDVGQIDEPEELRGTTYLAMELIKGKPLRAYVGDASVSIDERIQWLVQIAQALGAAHAAGLVHRDVKPENVMIREDRRVKVLDFGIAKRSASDAVEPTSTTEGLVLPTLTAQGVAVGTPMYMAPEQLRAERLDGRVDQFAWGVVAYELLTGKLPWSTEAGAITLVSQILSATPPPLPPELGVPPHVAAVVSRALSKDRADRFASMDALVLALDAPRRAASTLASPLAQSSFTPVPPAASAKLPMPAPAVKAPTSRRPRVLALAGVAAIAVFVWVITGTRGKGGKPAAAVAQGGRDAESVTCSNRACTTQHGGEPYACRASDHACVPIASPDCTPRFEPEDLARDDTVWIGAMFPLKGEGGNSFGSMNMEGADLARAEIAQALTSLGAAAVPRGVRRVALVECDDGEDAMRAARHLVDDVGVPGILGFRSGQEVIDVAGGLLIPRGVVAVASMTSYPLITRLPQPPDQPRLVWRTTFNYDSLAQATASLVHEAIEPRDRSGRPTRLSLVRSGSVASSTFADAFYRDAVFNGKHARDSGHDYQEIVLDPDAGVSTGDAVRLLAEAQPSIVVFLARDEECLAVVEALESRLPAGARRPAYVLALSDASVLAPFIGSSEERRRRAFGVTSSSSSTANARFVIRYNQARRVPVTRSTNPSSSYDAFYMLAYASFSVPPDERVTGVALATGFARLLGPGRSIEAGPTDIFAALDLLSSGKTIDLEGVASGLDFDPSTGEAPCDFSLDCPGVDEHGRLLDEDVESGVTYRARGRRTDGALRCP